MRLYHVFKRVVDIIISLINIITLFPLFIILSIWVRSTSKGPVIYKHTRLGKKGKPFEIYKFRTMVVGAREMQKNGVPTEKLITSSGKFLRKTFLDETPQLFNVLKGDISLIGPRPCDTENYSFFKKYMKLGYIFDIKPGITSLESVADYLPKRDRIKFEKHFKDLVKLDRDSDPRKHRFVLDSYYVKNESFLLDSQIIFYTILLMIKRIVSRKYRNVVGKHL